MYVVNVIASIQFSFKPISLALNWFEIVIFISEIIFMHYARKLELKSDWNFKKKWLLASVSHIIIAKKKKN